MQSKVARTYTVCFFLLLKATLQFDNFLIEKTFMLIQLQFLYPETSHFITP